MTARALGGRRGVLVGLAMLLLLLAASITCASRTASAQPDTHNPGRKAPWIIGVSNTLVGNGWREEMICSVKAQAKASGKVRRVVVSNINGGPDVQIPGMRNLISAGANAIVVNPSDRDALNGVIAQAHARGVVVVAVDQAVSSPFAYVATNDQVAYGRIGAEWLFKKLKGRGNVVEMRGIAGVPADTDRHRGFLQALRKYPRIRVVKETFTGWQFANGAKQMLDILNSGVRVDGVWTSGIDYTVVNAFKTAGKKFVPIVGADNNQFLFQLRTLKRRGLVGAAVTNPATIGGVGAAIALRVMSGQKVRRVVKLRPEVWDNTTRAGMRQIRRFYSPRRAATYSSQLFVRPWTTYTERQLVSCAGP